VIKRKYLIVALAVVSVLFGSLFYSNFKLVSGASSNSGSWGLIRFYEPDETMYNQSTYEDGAIFVWTPNNNTNNAILSIRCYFQYRTEVGNEVRFRIDVNGETTEELWLGSVDYTWTLVYYGDYLFETVVRVFPNQNNYTIKFQFASFYSTKESYVKDINIIIEVADGMVPNEYYKVELPSGVGGFTIPIDKFNLMAPYLALVATIILAVSISVAYIKYRKK